MKPALLFAAAVALSGFVHAAHIDSYPGKCHEWLEKIEEHNLRKEEEGYDGHGDKHNYKHEMVPECDEEGNFVPKQCHDFKHDDEWCQPNGECFHFKEGEKWCACVDVHSGMPDKHTLVLGGSNLHCDGESKPPCPWDWMKFGDHGHEYCYIYIDTPCTWVDAERYCQFEGGHLASIHCPEAHRFLQTLTRAHSYKFPPTWIGATNAVKPCFWFWMNGYIFDYEEFYMEENMFRPDSCLSINYKFKWRAMGCNETLPFICAKKPMYHYKELEYDHH